MRRKRVEEPSKTGVDILHHWRSAKHSKKRKVEAGKKVKKV